jgi:serine/threonine protein kinase
MRNHQAFLTVVARAVLHATAGGRGADLVEVLPEVAQHVWNGWGNGHSEAELRAEIQQVAQLPAGEARAEVEAVLAAEASGQPAAVRQSLLAYLIQVPSAIRASQRRPTDPSGRTVASRLPLRQADDLLPLLPVRLPRFHAGERPLPGVDWELEELLGVGGFGEVWKARNPHLRSAAAVALKFCLDPAAGQVLRHEATILDRVMREGKHPGIVQLLRTYLDAQTPCLEYEFLAGGDLAGVLLAWNRQGNRSAEQRAGEAARVVRRLAEIVGFAHHLKPPIVHRDLKPANILVQRQADGSLHLKVADFGIGGVSASQALRQSSRGISRAALSATAVRGAFTPLYASPQQVRGEPADPRDDVFALGVIWYQLLTGDLTQGRPGGSRWRDQLVRAGVAAGMITLLEACFEEHPRDRPGDAALLAEELAQLRASPQETPAAPPVSGGASFDLPTPPPPPAPAARPEPPATPAGSSSDPGHAGRCPRCGTSLWIPSRMAGQRLCCPHCNEVFTVPAEVEASPIPVAAEPYLEQEEEFGDDPVICSPAPTRARHRSGGMPHRGGNILTLGILSIPLSLCCALLGVILGIAAITMANRDLAQMDSGYMNEQGRGSTSAGRVCGVIGLVLGIINGILGFIMAVSR